MPSKLAFVCAALLLSACAPDEPGLEVTDPSALLDYNAFICQAQPVLIRRCSYLACHGEDTHALRLYSAGKLRLTPPQTRDDRDAPLTADEIDRNFMSSAALLLGSTADDRANVDLTKLPLLRKPLAARFGGDEHAGVGIFPVPPNESPDTDAEWQALVSWVSGTPEPTPLSADCKDLFDTLGVEPR